MKRRSSLWMLALILAVGCSGTGKKAIGDVAADTTVGDVGSVDSTVDVGAQDNQGQPDAAELVPADAAELVPPPCQSDADCGDCEACEPTSGMCIALPCAVECTTDDDCGPGMVCDIMDNGCCATCQPVDPCANVDCVALCAADADCPQDSFCAWDEMKCCSWCEPVCTPDCAGKQCGDDGCGGSCGTCQPGCACIEGMCAGCTDPLVELEPFCVHAPTVVQAGEKFAVAIYGLPGCSTFDHYEVKTQGTDYSVKIWGTSSPDPDCPPAALCKEGTWSYLGLVWLDAPNPGAYTVKVGNSFTFQVGASGGLIGEPACQDDCPDIDLEGYDWTLNVVGTSQLASQCVEPASDLWVGEPLPVEGTGQSYMVGPVIDLPKVPMKHCTQGHLLFGGQAPYWMEARVCVDDSKVEQQTLVILGTIQDALGSPLPEQFFLPRAVPKT